MCSIPLALANCKRLSCCPRYSRLDVEEGELLPTFQPGDLLRGSLPYLPMMCTPSQTNFKFCARFHTATVGRYTCTHPVDTTDATGTHNLCYVELQGQMRVSEDRTKVLLQKPFIKTHFGGAGGMREDEKVTVGILSPSQGEYEVDLPITVVEDDELEIGLELSKLEEVLLIESVLKPGRVYEWSHDNPLTPVNLGDEIVEVNGISGNADKMLEECETSGDLHFRLRRRGFVFAGEIELDVTPDRLRWPVQDAVLWDCDLDIRCGGTLSQALLREHVINWMSLSAMALVAVPFSTCEDGYRHWVPVLALPLLVRGLLQEMKLFKEHFRHHHRLMAELTGFMHPLVMIIGSRCEQLDIMTDTLFVARAVQCSDSVTREWQASWEQVPVVGSFLGAAAGAVGFGGFSVLLYIVTVLLPQGVLGYINGRELTSLQTSFDVDPCGVDGCQDILPLQDLAATSCFVLIEKSLEIHAQVQYNSGEPVVNEDVRLPHRVFIRSCLENFLQLWNQVTFLSLTYSDDDTMADVQVGGSIVLSLVLLLIKVNKLTSGEPVCRTILFEIVALPFRLCQVLLNLIATTFMWGISASELTAYNEEEAMRAQVSTDARLREKYQLGGGTLDQLELASIRSAGGFPLTMALRRHFHKLGLTSHRFTMLPKATVVAAALLWSVLFVLMRLAGVFMCESHSWNLSTLHCLPQSVIRGLQS
eukprot:CAMPEP_0177264118 /NCGR_PEP_ID=MMETSP0367-20130122/61367_1 /TAXON_ID=447022 ORGANISM="Scrippsiella hangoei-like, Strain SHHI-4" /NCGR_SAMPLE_ID=MMETSP0367 /ASSEMBLY_ACC=CAM_ASM_000362 /LENGTH=702 /DNA_ID=CAMNT_0018719173 /DNA_START=1 /DNA_END=2109 /DNA_ORIENTATION=+